MTDRMESNSVASDRSVDVSMDNEDTKDSTSHEDQVDTPTHVQPTGEDHAQTQADPNKKDSDTMGPNNPTVLPPAPPTDVNDSSNDSSILNMDKPTGVIRTKCDDIITRECTVKLTRLSKFELSSQQKTKSPEATDSGQETMSSDIFSEDDNLPLSEWYNKDRGRPCRKTKCVKYEESSPATDSDSDFERTPKKCYKPLLLGGPSAE